VVCLKARRSNVHCATISIGCVAALGAVAPMTDDQTMQEWVVPALGIAASPLPAAVMLLLLAGGRVVAKGTAFWLAWVAGVAVPTAAFVLLADRLEESETAVRTIAVGEIVAGLLLAVFAFSQGRGDGGPPAWLAALDRAGAARAAALGVLLSALNPKNLALALSGALAVAETDEVDAAALGFVLVAVSTVSALLGWRVLAPDRSAAPLAALRGVVARRGRAVGLVLGVLVGAYFVLDGFRRL
jgi:hypothetical protein